LKLRDIKKGQTVAIAFWIAFRFNFEDPRPWWRLEYGNISSPYGPGSEHATLVLIKRLTARPTKKGQAGDPCDSWLVWAPSEPTAAMNMSGQAVIAHDIARLTKPGEYSGHFHMPFAFVITDDLTNQCPP
jgi:hypothetical protein